MNHRLKKAKELDLNPNTNLHQIEIPRVLEDDLSTLTGDPCTASQNLGRWPKGTTFQAKVDYLHKKTLCMNEITISYKKLRDAGSEKTLAHALENLIEEKRIQYGLPDTLKIS